MLILRVREKHELPRKHGLHVQLFFLPNFLWELCIGDQETGDLVGVEEAQEGVDFGVHDGFTHQGEGTVFDCQAFLVPLWLHSRNT